MHVKASLPLWLVWVVLAVSPLAAAEPVRLRVLSYNIHHAEGVDGKLDLERIAQVIRSAEPDLVALQEVDKQWTHSTPEPLPTIPVAEPARQIDFVLFRPQSRWKVIEVQVLDEAVASDHRPILAVLELLPENGA